MDRAKGLADSVSPGANRGNEPIFICNDCQRAWIARGTLTAVEPCPFCDGARLIEQRDNIDRSIRRMKADALVMHNALSEIEIGLSFEGAREAAMRALDSIGATSYER